MLSGLGAQQSAKSQRKVANAVAAGQQQQSDYAYEREQSAIRQYEYRMSNWDPVGDANRYGFNPVTWLQSGMAAQYGNTMLNMLNADTASIESKKSGYMDSFSTVSNAPAKVSALSTIGNAVTAGATAYADAREAQAKVAASQNVMAKYLSSVQKARSNGNALAGLGTPAFHMTGPLVSGGGAAAALSLGYKVMGEKGGPTDISQSGVGWVTDTSEPDADVYFKREGWLGGLVPSFGTNVADLYAWGAGKLGYPNQRLGSDWEIMWNNLLGVPKDPNPSRSESVQPAFKPWSATDMSVWWNNSSWAFGIPQAIKRNNPFAALPPASGGYEPSYGD